MSTRPFGDIENKTSRKKPREATAGGDRCGGLRQSMQRQGVVPRVNTFNLNGRIQKFHVGSDRQPKGWLIGWEKPRVTVVWGYWKQPQKRHVWKGGRESDLSAAEEAEVAAQLAQAILKHRREKAATRQTARKAARSRWAASTKETSGHPYLRAKHVRGVGVRIHKGKLVVPLRDSAGEIQSLQTIEPDGTKRFLAGGRVVGCYWSTGMKDASRIVVAEGLATALTIWRCTRGATVAALSATNLKPVARSLRRRYPDAEIVIASDNDVMSERKSGANVGMVAGQDSAREIGGLWTFPDFGADFADASDFNDLARISGDDAVRAAIAGAAPVSVWPRPIAQDAIHAQTDLANAQRLVRLAGRDLMFVPGRGWHAWGPPWGPQSIGVQELVARVGAQVALEAADLTRVAARSDDESEQTRLLREAEALKGWSRRSESSGAIASAQRLAEGMLTVDRATLDANPWVIGCPNGVLDLRTGRLRDHSRTDFITKVTGCRHDSAAVAPRWKRFLKEVFKGDRKAIAYLQKLLGYCLLGVRKEQILVLFVGDGANGKTTLLNAVQHVLGDYGATAAPGLLLGGGDRHPTEVAMLRGCRLVVCTESPRDGMLNEERVKALTGSDRISARKLYEDFKEFEATHQLILQTNHIPKVRDLSHGFWRRIRVVEFAQTFAGSKIDRDLAAKLRREASGILNWLAVGAARYLKYGLLEPKSVANATNDYRSEQDLAGAFVRERCVRDATKSVSAADLQAAFKCWCEQTGETPVPWKDICKQLVQMGFKPGRSSSERNWKGIGLRK